MCTFAPVIISLTKRYKLSYKETIIFAQQSFTYRDFNIILFALSIAIVSNDAK